MNILISKGRVLPKTAALESPCVSLDFFVMMDHMSPDSWSCVSLTSYDSCI